MDATRWNWLRDEVRDAARHFAGQLRTLPDTSVRVPNLQWSAAELGQHLASIPGLYAEQNEIGAAFQPPSDWAAYSAAARAHLSETDPATLGELIRTEVERLLEPDEPDAQRMLYGQATTVANTAAGMLTELILHGRDLSALSGDRPELRRDQALAGIEQQMALAPVFIDRAKALRLAGVYGIHLRGGPDFTFHVDGGGTLTIQRGRPPRADARLSADPVAFVLQSLGRANPAVVALSGKIVAYGRRPWRLLALGHAVVGGV